MIRLDYDYPPCPGDIDHPDSYDYRVYYRVVPGLTFDMAKSGKMTPDVEDQFRAAIKFLDDAQVAAITGMRLYRNFVFRNTAGIATSLGPNRLCCSARSQGIAGS